jgi:hypothetical protein
MSTALIEVIEIADGRRIEPRTVGLKPWDRT